MSRVFVLLSIGVGVVLLHGCSKPAPEPILPADSHAPDAPADTSVAPAEVPAESSLAVKRGMLSLDVEHASFQLCGASSQLWVIDQTDVLRTTFANEPKPLELYVEAYGERTNTLTSAAAASAQQGQGAFIVEEVLYAALANESRGCNEPAPSYVVAARGNEPFWSIEVADDKLTWRQPDAPQELVFDAVQTESAEGTVGYQGAAQGHTIEVFVTSEPCRDSMSGAYFAYSARATFDDRQLTGCARIGG